MEFVCSHVVCHNSPERQTPAPDRGESTQGEGTEDYEKIQATFSSLHDYDNPILRDSITLPNSDLNHPPIKSPVKNNSGVSAPPLPPRFANKWAGRPACRQQTRQDAQSLAPPPLPHRNYRSLSPGLTTEVNLNIVSLQLGKMAVIRKESLAEKGDSPVLCYNCSAALSAISKTHQGQNIIMWICEFCDHPNCMNPATVPSRPLNDAVYALEWQRDRVDVEDALIVFCVDISGSMSVTSEVKGSKERSRSEHVSRLQCVKNGIMKSLQFLRQQSPRARVGLVTFNDEVTVFGGGLSSPLTLTDYELMDLDYLQERGRLYPTPQSIAETMSSLSRRVNEMIGCGATALGPAAVIAIEMAAKQVGSKVIVCTDGLANTGLGFLDSMEDELCESGSYFYTHLSETASTLGVVVSVLTFEGTDCRLAEVGKLADRTGGRVEIVNPGSLSHELQSILEDDVMATNMTLQFYVAKDMYFRYEEQVGNKLVREIGNVTKDAEITFEFGIKEADPSTIQQKRETFPFQLQADFTTRDQRRVRRIISHEKYITMNRAFVEDSINVMVLGVHAAQLSARLTMERRGGEAQRGVQAHTSLIRDIVEKKQNKEEEDIYENWMGAVASICEDAMGPCELEGDAGNIDSTVTVHGSALKGFSDEMMNAIFRMKNAKTKMLRKSNKTKN